MKHLATSLFTCACFSLHAQTFTSWTTVDGLPSDDIRDVAVAPDGTIWLATSQGVAAFDGNTFTVHTTVSHPGLASDDVMAIAVLSTGEVWAGTDFGVSVFNGSSYTTYTSANGLGSDQVKNIKEAPNGDVWICTIGGAARFSSSAFTAFGSPDIPFGGTMHAAFASNGDVLLSGGLGGVIVFNGSTFTTITTAGGLLNNRIRSIAVSDVQDKWVGTAEGISLLNAANAHVVDYPNAFVMPPPDELNPITDMLIDNAGRVWAAVYVDYLVTVGGVCVFNGSSWVQYEEDDGLAGPNVRRMALDEDGDIWVSTSTGLTEISDINIGIAERQVGSFSLFPNPASTVVDILLDEPPSMAAVLELRDATGRLVARNRVATMRVLVDVSGLDAGLYHAWIGDRSSAFVVSR